MNSQEIFETMAEQWVEFAMNHEKATNGNKSAGGRSRKAIGEIKKLVTEYRKQSISESKEG